MGVERRDGSGSRASTSREELPMMSREHILDRVADALDDLDDRRRVLDELASDDFAAVNQIAGSIAGQISRSEAVR